MITKLFKKAAVKFKLTPQSPYILIESSSHLHCHERIKSQYAADTLKFPDVFQVDEGYILHNGAFVDRFDAMKVVNAAGFIKDEYKTDKLFFDYKVDWSKVNET